MNSLRCLPAAVSRVAIVAVILGLISGCGGLSRPSPAKQTYLLQASAPTPVATPPRPATLKVGTISVAAPFRGKSMVYREGDLKYESDFYNEFFVTPSAMLTESAASWLAAAGVFREVLPAGANADGDFVLEGFISEFYGDYRDAGAPAAVLTGKFFLIDNRVLTGVPVWQTELKQRVALSTRSPDRLAAAFNIAWSSMLGDLAHEIAAAKLSR
jgi:cholesterol transport system auxiliary component